MDWPLLIDVPRGVVVDRPIVVTHAIKTTVAAFEETAALEGHPDRHVPLLALARMLASPLVERRVHQAAGTSLRSIQIDW